jgi:hypothetical protein
MEFLILALLIGGLFLAAGRLVPFAGKSLRNSWTFAVLLSAALVPVTVFVLNQSRLVLPQQTEVIEWIAEKWEFNSTIKKKYSWVDHNFVFIDNSYSNYLVAKPGNQLSSSTIPITDRRELSTLLQVLRDENKSVDLIVCDIYLDMRSADDTLLLNTLQDPLISSKFLAGNNLDHPTLPFFASLNDSLFGTISEKVDDRNFFSTYQIYKNNQAAWGYQVYARMQHLQSKPWMNSLLVREKKGQQWASLGFNSYIPHFELTDEQKLYRSALEDTAREKSSMLGEYNYFELGDLTGEAGNPLQLTATLQQRKKQGYRNIIFIGSFKGEDIDTHNTYYGRMHGPTIHLNLAYSLVHGQHRLNVFYLLYLWVFISVIIFVIIRHSLQLSLVRNPAPVETVAKKREQPQTWLASVLQGDLAYFDSG